LFQCLERVQAEDEQALEGHPAQTGRPKELPSLALWWAFVLCILRRKGCQREVWRLLVRGRLPSRTCYDVSDQAIYTRLASEGPIWLQRVFVRISAILRAVIDAAQAQEPDPNHEVLAPFASEVVALDETYLDPLRRILPFLRRFRKGDVALLPGKLVSVFDVRRQLWHTIHFVEDVKSNAKLFAPAILAHLKPGTLILADLGYFSFAWFDTLTRTGFFWISRLRQETSWFELHCYYRQGETFDGIVALGIWDYQAAYAVRLIQFRTPQGGLYQYVTNVCDPRRLSLAEIPRLYHRRWLIERAFHTLKRVLGLGWMWSGKTSVLLAQVWGVLIIAQLLQTLRMLVAIGAHVEPSEVSMELLAKQLADGALSGTLEEWIKMGQHDGLLRPCREKQIQVPTVSLQAYVPLPKTLVLQREARYPDALQDPVEPEERAAQAREQIKERQRALRRAEQERAQLRKQVQAVEKAFAQRQRQEEKKRKSQPQREAQQRQECARMQQRRDLVPEGAWPLPSFAPIQPWFVEEG
jgi:hypothetical protein